MEQLSLDGRSVEPRVGSKPLHYCRGIRILNAVRDCRHGKPAGFSDGIFRRIGNAMIDFIQYVRPARPKPMPAIMVQAGQAIAKVFADNFVPPFVVIRCMFFASG